MKSREQKIKELGAGKELLEKSGSVVFADFSGVSIALLSKLKSELKKSGAVFRVIKKRLLKIAFKQSKIDFDPTQYDAQVGSIFIPGELTESAGAIYKFSRDVAREKKEFKVLGAFDLAHGEYLDAQAFTTLAQLPSREVLLAQLANVLNGPLRKLMYVLQEVGKKGGESPAPEVKAEEVKTETVG
ncbi:MAG: 50S ribosomal protein L10 [Patescibacteria group bacterium]